VGIFSFFAENFIYYFWRISPKDILEIRGKGDPSKAARARKKREARRIYESPATINNLRRGNYFCVALPDKIIKKDRSRVKGKQFKNAPLQDPLGPQFHAGIPELSASASGQRRHAWGGGNPFRPGRGNGGRRVR